MLPLPEVILLLLGLGALLIMWGGPIALLVWSVRVVRRWTGAWRLAALIPVLAIPAQVAIYAKGIDHDPMGHGGWPARIMAITVASLLSAWVVSRVHRRRATAAGRTLSHSSEGSAPHPFHRAG